MTQPFLWGSEELIEGLSSVQYGGGVYKKHVVFLVSVWGREYNSRGLP